MKKLLLALVIIASSAFAKDTFIGTKVFKTDIGTTCTVNGYAKMLNSSTGIMTMNISESNGDNGVVKFKCEDVDIDDMKQEFAEAGTGVTTQSRCHSIYAHSNK